jgi:NAD-dependent deacetylase sirtuin 4
MNNEAQQKRYWVRGLVGFEQFSRALPNVTHKSLRALEVLFASRSASCDIVTQNVDRLHFKAGSTNAVELHGNAFTVKCTSCEHAMDRQQLHLDILNRNAAWLQQVSRAISRALSFDLIFEFQVGLLKTEGIEAQSVINPDGDADVVVDCSPFHLPSCPFCSSIVKPSVVFFGENVPETVTKRTTNMAATADAVLVIGSTLATYSSLRLVRAASAAGKPVVILNDAGTRGDEHATMLLREQCGEVMMQLLHALN